ncbi:MAG: hypothetical protein HYS44_03130 [Candidatus Niyogibacteria bacterium]|nr:hypothetical protein [Candidatus Niyogibacteria bacterium]
MSDADLHGETARREWTEKCAYRFYELRKNIGFPFNAEQDWIMASRLATTNPERSSNGEWGAEDNEIAERAFADAYANGWIRGAQVPQQNAECRHKEKTEEDDGIHLDNPLSWFKIL